MAPFLALAFALAASTVNGAAICPPTDATLKPVTFTGYVMDNFCIDMGTMVDNPTNKTLVAPQLHSIHCLVELPPCVKSQFAMLEKLATPVNDMLYSVKYQLGADGSALAMQYAMAAKAKSGTRGFTATVTGYSDGKSLALQCVSLAKTVNVDGKDMALTDADLAAVAPMTPATNTAATTTVAPKASASTTTTATTTTVAPKISAATTTVTATTAVVAASSLAWLLA
ncbi:Aste57867_17186 [Aphanomyces stellatus]|uniref:Aste57867_17186 protein n=1 Tax=Aphanomyces stellatus TaxID=120398 RepID=A0A485L766_9STRA|nr:hypothetical protein As57867_017127 [Aphanomyces stellatus]VFT93943.1 Aste57867_17186 [Aphanomyces stellatus]